MTDPDLTDGIALPDDAAARLTRLERRLQRERAARREAEDIAERGMRDLWLSNRDLEARVEARTWALRNSLVAATVAAEAKEQFLTDLGHELTSPLHAMLGQLELIDPAPLQSEDRQRLDTARAQANQLASLLQRLVDLAAAGGVSSPEAIVALSPAEWLDSTSDSWTRRAALAGHLLLGSNEADDDAVRLDWHRLRRITDIVLSNAITHTRRGPVHVSIRSEPGAVLVAVTDPGPGVADEQIALVFEPFTRGQHLGAGLAIAKRLATSAGGDIEMRCDHDAEGAPTTVTYWLPTQPDA